MKKGTYLSGLLVSCFLFFSIAASATVPVVTANPAPDTVCSGSIAKFSVTVTDTTTGATPVIYMWQVSTDGGTTWSFITDSLPYSHSATDTLYVTASNALNGYEYRSIDTTNDGADTSLAAALRVDTSNIGAITGASAICQGSSVTLSDATPGGVWSHINHLVDTLTPAGVVTGRNQGMDTITYVVTNTCGTAIAMASLRVDITATMMPITGPSATCIGNTIDLMNANVTGDWVWSASNTNASITHAGTLMGLAAGMDTITYAFANACNSVSSSIVIAVDAPLGAGVISGVSNTVCAGSWISLTETITGGVWISSSSIAVVDGSGNVTGISAGTAVISYLLSNACGSSVARDTITVITPAVSISGGDSAGVHATLALSDATTGGTWAVADESIASIDAAAGIATGVSTGSTTVIYTVTNSCGSSSATMTLYVGTPPSSPIEGLDSVCIGATITLTDSIPGGIWLSSADTIAAIDGSTGVLSGISSGYVTISYIAHNAFGTDTVYASIFVNLPPAVVLSGPSPISLGQNYYFIGAPCCGTFTTSNDLIGMFISYGVFADTVVDSVRYPYAGFGSFVVAGYDSTEIITYTVTNSCGTRSANFAIHLPKPSTAYTPVITGNNERLNVYPNPNQGEFTINLASENTGQVPVTITNLVGEKVKEFMMTTNTGTTITLNQPAGIYFLTANTANGKYTQKITITN